MAVTAETSTQMTEINHPIGDEASGGIGYNTPENQSGPTVEQAGYGLLFLLALALRLYRLGTLDMLAPIEAAQAWPAWLGNNAGQLPVPVVPVSPLLFTLQRVLFLLTGGGSEFWIRFAPAVLGAGTVLVAWNLRTRLGRIGALIAAVLITLDPWLLSFSRLGDSAILSVCTGLLLLAWLFQEESLPGQGAWQQNRIAVTTGLFLISGPLAWLLLPPLLFGGILLNGGILRDMAASERRRAGLILVATMVIGSTGLLAHLSGLATIGESLGAALGYLFGDIQTYPLAWALLRILVDEPFLLLFGGGGLLIALATMRETENPTQQAWLRTLSAWIGWGLLCVLLPGRNPVSLLVLGIPLLLLAGQTAAAVLRFGLDRLERFEAALVAATMTVLLVTATFWTGNATTALQDGNLDARLLLFYLLIPVLGAFFVWWAGIRTAGQVFGLILLAAFFLANVSSSWMLNLRPELDHNRSLLAVTGDDDLRLFLDDVARLSSLRAGDPTEAQTYLLVSPRLQPLLGWHLRKMRQLHWQTGIDPAALDDRSLVIGDAGATLRLPDQFIGSRYAVTQRWLPTELEDNSARLRWILYRERRQMPTTESVELWVTRE